MGQHFFSGASMTTYTGTITAKDGSGKTATVTVTLNQVPALAVTATVAPISGPPGTLYTITAVATGGVPPYTYTASPVNGIQPQPVANQSGVFTVTI